jgi:hypothetical protein
MSTFFHHPTLPQREENHGQPCPEGWTGPHSAEDSEAEMARRVSAQTPAPVAPTYTRADYKAALDAMILSQCKHGEWDFDGVQTLAVYLFDQANEFYPRAHWLARLNVFTWTTSNQLAAAADANPEAPKPTPEQFAAYILSLFEASNPRPL